MEGYPFLSCYKTGEPARHVETIFVHYSFRVLVYFTPLDPRSVLFQNPKIAKNRKDSIFFSFPIYKKL